MNKKEIIEKLEKDASNGDVEALTELAEQYCVGIYVEQDLDKAEDLYTKAAEKGYAKAQFELGRLFFDEEESEDEEIMNDNEYGLVWIKKAANNGYAEAQSMLGDCYYDGAGVKQDYKEAFKWLKMAAGNGSVSSYLTLGKMYRDGIGTPKDLVEAFKWVKKAAENGDDSSYSLLSEMYRDGIGTQKDIKLANEWHKNSNKVKFKSEQNEDEAFQDLNSQSIENLNSYDLKEIADSYYFGKGVTKDYENAIKYYKLASDKGSYVAQFKLGDMYRLGEGIAKDYIEAIKYYKLAANQDFKEAYIELAAMYEKGQGVLKDLDEAYKYYKLAAKEYHIAGAIIESPYKKDLDKFKKRNSIKD